MKHKRREVEVDNFARLRSEEACLQEDARLKAAVAQLAGLIYGGDAEVAASLRRQRARYNDRTVPVSIGLDHHHQLAVRCGGFERVIVRVQRVEIYLRDRGASHIFRRGADVFPAWSRPATWRQLKRPSLVHGPGAKCSNCLVMV